MGGVINVTPRPRFTPGTGPRVPIGWVWWVSELVSTQKLEQKSFAPAWDRTSVQFVVKHYTD
jgi:hypothetical protein